MLDVEELGVLVLDVGMLDVEGLQVLVVLLDVLVQLVEVRDVEILEVPVIDVPILAVECWRWLYCWRMCWCCWLKCRPYSCWMCLCLMFSYLMSSGHEIRDSKAISLRQFAVPIARNEE